MKTRPRLIILAPFLALVAGSVVFFTFRSLEREALTRVQPLDFDSAVKVLATTKSSRYGAIDIQAEQLAAMAVIRKARKEVDLKILLPFLNVTTENSFYEPSHIVTMENRDAAEIKWPMFALILNMPGAAPALEKYCLDATNPPAYRLDAYHLLAYLDKDRLKNDESQMLSGIYAVTLDQQAAYLRFIDGVEFSAEYPACGGYGFDGPVEMRDLKPWYARTQEFLE
jgi:hypothetical protein